MPLPSVYAYTAAQCPAVMTPLAPISPSASGAMPTTWTPIQGGVSAAGQNMVGAWQGNAARGDLQGRYSGGLYGVLWGLNLVPVIGMQKVTVKQGAASLDGPADLPADTVLPLSAGLCRVWISQGRSLGYTVGSLAPPDTLKPWAFLGTCPVDASGCYPPDYSGVFSLTQGHTWMRGTADPGVPTDTPPAGVRFHSASCGYGYPGTLYLWDGLVYRQADGVDVLAQKFRALLIDYKEFRGFLPDTLEDDYTLGLTEA